ncbi:hypothetical protein DFH08DRAFT_818464 [Mycena albidolilacea]|uniref:Uncharacterized protein n=1 Tax=Mycena albidolilacea TaxID=1033008 RepID=A0AAD6ZGP3_9AGAR|nr:hypothetical protein DFH08DRAFT_818464 [Mycena albidolilacea]
MSELLRQLAKMDGVDVENPPPPEEEKMFWPAEQQPGGEPDNIAMLARRHVAANKSQSSPNITINNDYAGLATLLQPLFNNTPSSSTRPTPTTPAIIPSRSNASASPAKSARMTMTEFCIAFDLSDDIMQHLAPLELDGPHLLEFIKNQILDQYLKMGQRVAVQYAESVWKKGKTCL